MKFLQNVFFTLGALMTSTQLNAQTNFAESCHYDDGGNAEVCDPFFTDDFFPLFSQNMQQGQPGRQRCGIAINTSLKVVTSACTVPGGIDIYGPMACNALPPDLDQFCNDQALINADPTTGAGSCLIVANQACATSTCGAPACGQCPLSPTRGCVGSATRPNVTTLSVQNNWTGARRIVGAGMCDITCRPRQTSYTITMDCRCRQNCTPCN